MISVYYYNLSSIKCRKYVYIGIFVPCLLLSSIVYREFSKLSMISSFESINLQMVGDINEDFKNT